MCQVNCGGGIFVDTNLGTTNVFNKTKLLKYKIKTEKKRK